MAFVPALVPLGVSLARIARNTSDDDNHIVVPHRSRSRSIVDKMTKGGAHAPITEWSEAKLEKAISRNSMFRDHADELRLARVNGLVSAAKTASNPRAQPIAPVVAQGPTESVLLAAEAEREANRARDAAFGAPIQDSSVPDALGQADVLLLAAEAEREANPARDAALEALADNSFDAILITDAEGIIAYSNKSFTKLTGYDQADVIGKSPKLLQGPGTDQKVLARLKESMQKGDGDYEGSALNYKKDGTAFIMHWRVVPVKVDGKVKAWLAIQREGLAVE